MLAFVLAIILSPIILAGCGLLIASRMKHLRWLVHLAFIPAILIVGPVGFVYISMGIGAGFFAIMLPIVLASLGIYACAAILIGFHHRDAQRQITFIRTP
jgi:hypothetical protein